MEFENSENEKDLRSVLREKRDEAKSLSNEINILKQGDRDINEK